MELPFRACGTLWRRTNSLDDKLQKAVIAELSWDPDITASHIGVSAEDGVVTLLDHVNSFVQKHAAEDAARRVKGVRAVAKEAHQLAKHQRRYQARVASLLVLRPQPSRSAPGTVIYA